MYYLKREGKKSPAVGFLKCAVLPGPFSGDGVCRETSAEGENGISLLLIMDYNQSQDYRES